MRSAPLLMIGILALPTACGGPAPTAPAFHETNWKDTRRSDIGCPSGGITVTDDYYDLNHDGDPEAFLLLRCTTPSDPGGDQLEIVRGGADPATTHPHKLVFETQLTTVDKLCFADHAASYRSTRRGQSQFVQITWPKGAPAPNKPTPGRPAACR